MKNRHVIKSQLEITEKIEPAINIFFGRVFSIVNLATEIMIKKITIPSLVILLLSSCAVHFGALQSSVSLHQANFKVVKTAAGSAQTKVIFGIGGLKQEALVAEARKDLTTKANLTEGQVFANLTMDYKTTFYPAYIPVVLIQKVTITADVIEFMK